MRTRMCIETRQTLPEDQLIRFVKGPDDEIVADLKCRLPGRGVWVSADKKKLLSALQKGKLSRGLECKSNAKMDIEVFVDTLEKLLNQRVLNSFALARKAGHLITGFEKVSNAIIEGKIALLIEANDAASGGVRKLRNRAKNLYQEDMPYIESGFNIDTLSQALGHDNVVHGALLTGQSEAMVFRAIVKRDRFLHNDI